MNRRVQRDRQSGRIRCRATISRTTKQTLSRLGSIPATRSRVKAPLRGFTRDPACWLRSTVKFRPLTTTTTVVRTAPSWVCIATGPSISTSHSRRTTMFTERTLWTWVSHTMKHRWALNRPTATCPVTWKTSKILSSMAKRWSSVSSSRHITIPTWRLRAATCRLVGILLAINRFKRSRRAQVRSKTSSTPPTAPMQDRLFNRTLSSSTKSKARARRATPALATDRPSWMANMATLTRSTPWCRPWRSRTRSTRCRTALTATWTAKARRWRHRAAKKESQSMPARTSWTTTWCRRRRMCPASLTLRPWMVGESAAIASHAQIHWPRWDWTKAMTWTFK